MKNTAHIKKYSKIDKKHTIISRTCLQVVSLIKYTSLTDQNINKIYDFCFNSSIYQLENIWQTTEKINDEYYDQIHNFLNNSNNTFPYIEFLKNDIENILYSTKNLLRDLSNNVIKPNYPIFNNTEGGSFSNLKTGKSEFSILIKKIFGVNSNHYKNSVTYSNYISELIAKRNALEHPGGLAGNLEIFQPEILISGKGNTLTRLYWSRKNIKTDLLKDLYDICLNLLFFIEYVLVFIIVKPNLLPGKKLNVVPGNMLKHTNNIKYIVN